jgi:alpha-D-xyloside xylohydrolase
MIRRLTTGGSMHQNQLLGVIAAAFFATTVHAHTCVEGTPVDVTVTPTQDTARPVRLRFVSDRIVRVTVAPADAFEQPQSLAVVAPWRCVKIKHAEENGEMRVTTGRLDARVNLASGAVRFVDAKGANILAEEPRAGFEPVTVDGQKFFAVRQQWNRNTDEALYGLGQHQNAQMNYNGEDVELAQHNMDVGIPFVVSTRNYGLLWDNASITRFGNPRAYGLASRDLELADADGKPGGLTASYFVKDALKVKRVEKDINYAYIQELLAWPKEVGPETQRDQKVVWEGTLKSAKAGVHRFRVYSSSYVKVFIDDKLLLTRWRQNWNPWYHNLDLPLTAGKRHKIRIEWLPDGGYLALLHNDPLPAADLHSVAFASEVAKGIDYYYIQGSGLLQGGGAAGAGLDDVIAGFRELTGKAVLPPRWAYGFWQSRQRYNTQEELLGVVREYRQRGIGFDNIVQDWFYWREDDWGSHKFDPKRFPDPKAMIDEVHKLNANFMISVWGKFYPSTDNFKELDGKGYIYKGNLDAQQKDWVGPGYLSSFYDPYSAEARSIYWRQIRENLDVLGVDAWWLDSVEPDIQSNLSPEERIRRQGPTAIGPAAQYFNAYPLVHNGGVYAHSRATHPDRRPMILTRSAFTGQQRYGTTVWSGDVVSRWDDLHDQVSAGVNFSLSGMPNWSFDIGGFALEARFNGPNVSAADAEEWRELNTRWFQFGAFAPVFRSHGEAPFREIWNIAPPGSETYDTLVRFNRLRYRLMPYVYTLAADTWHRDSTMMRGLVMDFPGDVRVRNLKTQYLFGDAFLVSPVVEHHARSRKVYLPAGSDWYDFWTGARLKGGREIVAAAPLTSMPLHVRAGSIVPVGPEIQYTSELPGAPITLFVYAGRDGSFDLYEDDGVSNAYERGEYTRIPLRYDDKSRALTIAARVGRFPGMVEKRVFKVRWIDGKARNAGDLDAPADAEVEYTGAPLRVQR